MGWIVAGKSKMKEDIWDKGKESVKTVEWESIVSSQQSKKSGRQKECNKSRKREANAVKEKTVKDHLQEIDNKLLKGAMHEEE